MSQKTTTFIDALHNQLNIYFEDIHERMKQLHLITLVYTRHANGKQMPPQDSLDLNQFGILSPPYKMLTKSKSDKCSW